MIASVLDLHPDAPPWGFCRGYMYRASESGGYSRIRIDREAAVPKFDTLRIEIKLRMVEAAVCYWHSTSAKSVIMFCFFHSRQRHFFRPTLFSDESDLPVERATSCLACVTEYQLCMAYGVVIWEWNSTCDEWVSIRWAAWTTFGQFYTSRADRINW